jgi:hypothetical protein
MVDGLQLLRIETAELFSYSPLGTPERQLLRLTHPFPQALLCCTLIILAERQLSRSSKNDLR